ncbi:MAG: GIY-YIG nuclease family protein, partial [Pseudanabaenaceae cyanobacterium]
MDTVSLRQQPEKLEARLREIPAEPGVYLMRDRHDGILYVGKSKCLRQRVRSYFRPKADHSPRIAAMVDLVADIEFIATDTEAEALALEDNLIKKYQPYYNVLLKDDKQYPYVCITWSETYPRIFITRRRRQGEARDRYYGPYVDAGALRRTLAILKRVFPLRQRPRPLYKDRPCLNYHIGLCPGVCQGLIAAEDYRQTVRRIAAIFQGRTQEPIAEMEREMAIAAEN